MNILVTGAAGFIGSHAVELLLDQGHTVIGVDNFNDYYSPTQKRTNVAAIGCHARAEAFTLYETDIRDRDALEKLFERHELERIVHLAAMAGVRASVEQPHLYFDVNLNGTLTLLELARNHGRPPFVFASTSSVYGETQRIPFVEDDACAEPRAPYPASKRAAELIGYTYHHLHGQQFTALRFFTVYGPRNRPDMMAYKLAHSAFFGSEVELFKGGAMSRDWTYVKDIVAGITHAVDKPLGYEIINLGRGQPTLLSDFVTKIANRVGKIAKLRNAAMPDGDVSLTWADVSKARRLLGYEPQMNLDAGIDQLVSWFEREVVNPQARAT